MAKALMRAHISGTVNDMDEPIERVNGKTRSRPGNHAWRKSSRSMSDGHCIEVALSSHYTLMRDSKNITGPELTFHVDVWNSFIQKIKTGRIG